MSEPTTPQPIIVKRQVKHVFSREERDDLNTNLLGALQEKTTQEAEFDSVKASYKAKITAAESQIESLAASLRAGFDHRVKECSVTFLMPEKKKRIAVVETGEVVATEDMTQDDLQIELLQAEANFDHREVIPLFETGSDRGELAIGMFKNRWFAAARLKVGQHQLNERLDSEQKSFKNRWDAIRTVAKNANDWLKSNFKELSKGFEEPIEKAIEPQKERVE